MSMNNQNQRYWKVLCWNVRGTNSQEKWNLIRDTISNASCDIFCLQETKRQNFDNQAIRNFSPPGFNSFAFQPSIGASGGILTSWKSNIFIGQLIFQNNFVVITKMTAKHNGEFWFLANIYGPCSHDGKRDFLRWFKHYNITDTENWLLVGDFNLLRKPENRNRVGVTSMRCYSLMMQSTILA